MITLAIDGSTKATGIALFDNKDLLHYTLISNNSKDVLYRIKYMTDEIEKIYKQYTPDQIIMEQIIPDNLNEIAWSKNQKTFKALFYLQAAIVLMFYNYNKEVEFIPANTWRSRCGIKTGAGIKRDTLKAADIKFVKENYNILVSDDVADAIGIGYAKVNEIPQPQPFNWE